jgi:hypothetical protein
LGSLACKKNSYNPSCAWVKLARISFNLPNYIVSYFLGTVAAIVTLGVSHLSHSFYFHVLCLSFLARLAFCLTVSSGKVTPPSPQVAVHTSKTL